MIRVALLAMLCLAACGSPDVDNRTNAFQAVPAEERTHARAATSVAGPELFGVHYVAAWASPARFPDAAGIYRMHDATPRWDALHTGPGRWYTEPPPVGKGIGRIDAVLLFRDRNAPGIPVIYVLGGAGSGGTGFPAWTRRGDVMGAWREHVRYIARRYAGRIAYYEVWNEPDAGNWYTGTVRQLAELTRIAAEEIRAADPAARIIAPSFTQAGHAMMDEFYALPVAEHIDIVGWHHGIEHPERDTANIEDAFRILRRHGIDRPLWATEINLLGGAGELARAILVHWLHDVGMVGYYSWEMPTYYGGDDGFAHTTDAAGRITAAGTAFGTLRTWIEGRTATDVRITGDTWSVTLDNGDVIVWTSGSPSRISIPAGTRHTLDGAAARWAGGTWTTTAQPVRFSRAD
jgi:hypothetical protein